MPSGEMAQYSMTKTMNLSLAKSLSKLTVGSQVTVNTILPGSTLTEGVQEMLTTMYADSQLPESEWEQDFMKNHRPLSQIQRLIRPEEIGRFVALFLAPMQLLFLALPCDLMEDWCQQFIKNDFVTQINFFLLKSQYDFHSDKCKKQKNEGYRAKTCLSLIRKRQA